jgi:histidinol-phosphatase
VNADLQLALELADLADAITLPRFRARDLRVDTKADHTPVTEADRGAEAALRERLAAARPHHAVLGEEEGLMGPAGASNRWVLDPIDGTANYVRGVPIWATLIGLMDGADVVVGVVSAPALGRRWWAARGEGAFADGEPIHVSDVATLAAAHLAHSGVGTFYEYGHGDTLVDLTRRVWRSRGLGDFWMHCLVAEGAFDIAVEPVVSLWDLAAVAVIVEEAGGRFTDLSGAPGPAGGSALSTNGHLHDELLEVFARPGPNR